MALQWMSTRRMLPTTGISYYGTETFVFPAELFPGAPQVALPPGASVSIGYDFMCLLKDIRRTNCADIQVSVWSVMTCIAAMVMIFCVVLIPIACIYRSGRFAGSGVAKMFRGSSYNPYEEMEKRAEAHSGEMPAPPKVSQYRQGWGPNYSNNQKEEEWED